jgi:hypothetical protein
MYDGFKGVSLRPAPFFNGVDIAARRLSGLRPAHK